MKRVIIGIGWFAIFSLVISFTGGFIVGFIAGFNDPENAVTVGAEAGRVFGEKYGGIVFIISALLAIIGTATGKLPYTQKKTPPPK